jgi:DNA-binding CsgD family transcriptional regulator
MAQFIVLEGAGGAAVDAAAAELAADGRAVVRGWVAPGPGRTVCVGRVSDVRDASAAVLAAVRGARLVADADAPREVIDQLCDDLRRIGDVDHRIGRSAVPAPGAALSGEQRALLAHLLAGATLGDAARSLHISRRTADRRLAAARAALAARSTAEALRRAAELGVEPAS